MEKNQCTHCDGLGHCLSCDGFGRPGRGRFECSACNGTGRCSECDGYGYSYSSAESEEELKEHQRGGLAHPHEFIKKKRVA